MNRNTVAVGAIFTTVVSLAAIALTPSNSTGDEAVKLPFEGKVRIGIYDSRAIAIAWAASEFNPVKEKRAELEAAKKTGNQRKVKELGDWGSAHQRLLHFQGFGRVPVSDLLSPVKNEMAMLAKEKGLSAITSECDHAAPNVEVLDVTEALVELFKPTDRTRSIVREMKGVKPLGLLELADMKDTH